MNNGTEIINNVKKRGYILIDSCYYPPNSAEALLFKSQTAHNTPKKESRLKRIKTAWIDDTLNIKNRNTRIGTFTALVKHATGLIVWPEFRFLLPPAPDYRFDYAIPISQDNIKLMIAIEVNGGIWARGDSGHSSGIGIQRDMDKSTYAAVNGWTLIQCTPTQLCSTRTLDLIRQAATIKSIVLP